MRKLISLFSVLWIICGFSVDFSGSEVFLDSQSIDVSCLTDSDGSACFCDHSDIESVDLVAEASDEDHQRYRITKDSSVWLLDVYEEYMSLEVIDPSAAEESCR